MSTQSSDEKLIAVLQSAKAPTDKQRSRLLAFLKRTYGREAELTWERDDSLEKGFRLKVGSDVYDWSLEGRMRQFQERMQQLEPGQENIVPLMRQAIENWTPAAQAEEVGQVLTVGDEIATVSGLERAEYGEILGMHIIGPRATDLIAEGALAIGGEMTLDELIDTIHSHPTVTETMREAALNAEKRAIHTKN